MAVASWNDIRYAWDSSEISWDGYLISGEGFSVAKKGVIPLVDVKQENFARVNSIPKVNTKIKNY